MLNISYIINNATENSLILLDELGSGTDPLEGANLAISILEHLEKAGTLVISTTHYQELKKYALKTNNFENASVEFDINTLSPTYRLLIGFPGKSNAFEISKKLGLKSEIIDRAKGLMSSEEINFEELLKNIYVSNVQAQNNKDSIQEELNKIHTLRVTLEKNNSNLKQREQEIINNAKIKARDMLFDAKEEVTDIIKQANDIKNSNSSEKKLNNLRNKLNTDLKTISLLDPIASEKTSTISISREEIKPNTPVFVNKFKKNGVVVSNISKNNEVQVQIGSMKMSININDLSPINKTPEKVYSNLKKTFSSEYTKISKSKNVSTEINVIGLNVEESIPIVDKFLDDCSLSKLQTVRIVHGKGTGKLRDGIHKFLRKHPHVKSFRIGTFGEGEMGVTVIELK